jgi:hypothetical protein
MVENFKINETNHCGKCPECDFDWDKGEVVDVIRNSMLAQDYYKNNPELILKIDEMAENNAKHNYGWTPQNKLHISKLLKIEPSDSQQWNEGMNDIYQCPNCFIAWDSVSGQRTEKYKVMVAEGEAMLALIAKMNADKERRLANS